MRSGSEQAVARAGDETGSMGDGPAIELTGLTKRYGPVVGVDRLSLTVRPGEVFGFLGPNGATRAA